ncbi:2Fe-2S iron-sulfur cluster-binding protein [Streptomyces sp. NPDC091371]|uniref:2Fe-2S iron-sulfur cluster-binding protein n=1 Tax=Streptomyces sp. NPDC091371 TaxID=3155303 RepID=UPI003417B3B8
MSENENENVTQGNGTNGTAGWGWEPVPQGGEYDSDATAFVKLPQDMLDALGTGEPLAAPGHGYVPPPMIVPLGSASTDPAATGTWTIPVQWPEAGGSVPADSGPVPTPAPVGGPIPASVPIPAAVAAAFAEAEPEQAQPPVHDPGATAEWRFQDEASTGQWAVPAYSEYSDVPEVPEQQGDFRPSPSALDADWSQAPATLPGGAPAPWAYLTQDTGADAGVLPGTDEAAAAAAAAAAATAATAGRLLGGPGVGTVGTAPRGPRVLGGPGVGTPLPEEEPAHPAPHDIEAAHGSAQEPAEGARAAGHAEFGGHAGPGGPGDFAGHTGHAGHAEHGGFGGHAEHAGHAGQAEIAGRGEFVEQAGQAGQAEFAGAAGTDGHGFSAFGHAAEPAGMEAGGAEPAAAEPGLVEPALAEADLVESEAAEAAWGEPGRMDHAPAEPGPGRPALAGPAAADRPAAGDGPAPAEPAAADRTAFLEPAAGDGPGPVEPAAGDGPGPVEPAAGDAAGDRPADAGGARPGGAVPADDALVPAPDADTADSALSPPDADPTGGVPAEVSAYEEENEHPQASYVLRVNGADRPVTGAWIGESLLYVLRERLGLAGAKDGCSQGECGACAVQVDGRLVASCLVPAATAAGSEVRTVEGLATNGELSDVQQALCRSGAVQCGFCVPGMAMTIHDLLEGNHAPSELETRQALCGNLCRCSGYSGVVDAVREVVAEREAAAAEAAAWPEQPRIPHQAAPGEGGIHHGGTA